MRNFQKKPGPRHFFQSKPILIILALILLIIIWNTFSLMGKMRETNRKKEVEEAKIADLESRKEKLLNDIERLNTIQGKEEIIRENFGVVKEGEQVIVIVEDKNEKEIIKEEESKFRSFFRNLFDR